MESLQLLLLLLCNDLLMIPLHSSIHLDDNYDDTGDEQRANIQQQQSS